MDLAKFLDPPGHFAVPSALLLLVICGAVPFLKLPSRQWKEGLRQLFPFAVCSRRRADAPKREELPLCDL